VHTEQPSTNMFGMIGSVKLSALVYKHANDLNKLIQFMFVPILYLASVAPLEIFFDRPADV